MKRCVVLDVEEYEALVARAEQNHEPKQSVIQGYVEGAVMGALFRKFVADGESVVFTDNDFAMRQQEELVKINEFDGSIRLFMRPKPPTITTLK